LFSIFIHDLCAKIHFSEILLFADGLKIFYVIKSPEDCKALKSVIDYVQKWCPENYMKTNIFKTNTVHFTRKTNSIHFNYFVGDLLTVRTDCLKDLVVMLASKLHYHRHVHYLHSQTLKLLGPIVSSHIIFLPWIVKFVYITLILSKLEYASVAWNNLTLADSNKLENIQRKFANLCYNRFIQHNTLCNYESMLGPPLWSSGQSFWLQIQRSRVRSA
jgi:hypothetical protein